MSKSVTETPLVTVYLHALRRQAESLPASRRAELIEEIASHIEFSLPEMPSEVQIREVLDRLGTPEEIVDAELEGAQEPLTEQATREPLSHGDIAGLLLLLLGGVALPPVGYMIGTALIGASRRWSALARTIMVALPFVAAMVIFVGMALDGLWDSPADLIGKPLRTLGGYLDIGLAALPYTAVQVAALVVIWFFTHRPRSYVASTNRLSAVRCPA